MSLVYLSPLGINRDADGRLGIPAKTASGLAEYVSRWQGGVVASSLVAPAVVPADAPGMCWQGDPALEGVQLVAQIGSSADAAAVGARLVQAQVTGPESARALELGVPVVYDDDNSPDVRRQVMGVGASAVGRARILAGSLRRQGALNRLVRAGAGLQCNGFAAHEYYSRIRPDALRFFDHRITDADVEAARARGARPLGDTVTLGFSGRLVGIKGVELLPAIMRELRNRGRRVRLVVTGTGPLEAQLRESLAADDELRGFVDFESEWKAFIGSTVDLMVLPHLQGDSSSTYFESLGVGVPVIGFENATLTPLAAETGAAWTAPMGDVAALATRIGALIDEPAQLDSARAAGLDFMAEHTVRREFDRRLAHFAACAAGAVAGS